ncbi:uncharacterized protein E5676_scaffold702G00050 [Cucumis melo var. makuwa]|uniref:Reverse transcriptase domain-containing protein n=1 Tax=Cucumis melo var. makuwa TaxID=1194695 RepID=A0A5A7T723_CUCMM|nr:uncharacterized protein E6C27_scaffold379G001940 [Cucumis melo var. makuwa]TYK07519.1 uncharacterized protein E5676_scaffold702G00050 [Cucumis melo var. makuwa]
MPGLDPKIEVEVNKLIEAGFIREVKYPTWIANIVPVRKKNEQLRVCVDFRDLNNACPKDDFPLPITEIMVDATTGHEALSFMDRSSGYNQIQMALSDEEMTAFKTSKGIYCYKVMPFGLKNACATYQRAMQKVFGDMLHKYVECYIDDLVVKSKRRQNHLTDLKVVFDRLQKYQLRMMNPLKGAFGVTSGKFLGFIVHSNLAGRRQPFQKLMRKGENFVWEEAYQNAFDSIKKYLLNPPVLGASISGKPLILYIAAQESLHGSSSSKGVPYKALIIGLQIGLEIGVSLRVIYGDSKLIINQVSLQYYVKHEDLKSYFTYARQLMERFDSVMLEDVPRIENKRADALANLATALIMPDNVALNIPLCQRWIMPPIFLECWEANVTTLYLIDEKDWR